MRKMEIFIGAVLLLSIAVSIVSIISMNKPVEVAEVTEIKMTEEEMKARPVVVTEKVTEPIEDIITDDTFLFDVVPLNGDLQLHAERLCREYHVSYSFFLAMCESESAFITDAKGDSGKSVGLMQINKPNWDRYGLNAFIVEDNIEIGIRMMGELIEKYQEFDMVVMCYKAGEGKANELREQGVRLKSCDDVANSAMWWEAQLAECRR